MIDTHTHLTSKDYDTDRDLVLARAGEQSVTVMIDIGIDLESSRASVRLAGEHDCLYAAVGIHPHDASTLEQEALSVLRDLARSPRVVAIGETGLDFYRDLSPRDLQRWAFREQIQLALELKLPLVVHSRQALDETLGILGEEGAGAAGGVLHCYPGGPDDLPRVLDLGFHISVGGALTYDKSGRIAAVVRAVPLERLLLETDCPYLTPVPHRGKRNEPSYLTYVAGAVAKAREQPIEEIDRVTSKNAARLFGLRAGEQPAQGERSERVREEGSLAYKVGPRLYLNITNRCSNDCQFCVRNRADELFGYRLKLSREPNLDQIVQELDEDLSSYQEVVFCGYGEPLLRPDLVVQLAQELRKRRARRIRINTNGQANAIWGRNVVPEIAPYIDAVRVSLNAQDDASYEEICRPQLPQCHGHGLRSVVQFIEACKKELEEVTASIVRYSGVDESACLRLADKLGIPLVVRG